MLNFKILFQKNNTLLNHQIIRWNRSKKPFWLGIAKSKMFIIKEPKVLPEPENTELQRLRNNYNTYFKSLINFVKYENPIFKHETKNKFHHSFESSVLQKPDAELKEFNVSSDEDSFSKNEAWNAKSAELRKNRLKILEENLTNKSLRKISDAANHEKQILKKVEQIVNDEKIKSKSYINLENLNEAIDKCLNSEIDYNFAIDLYGNKYTGQNSFKV